MAKHSKRFIAVILAFVMVLGLAIPAGAATNSVSEKLPFTESSARPDLRLPQPEEDGAEAAETPADDDMFRVSIILEDESTLDKGYATYNIANNKKAISYRDSLKAKQEKVEATIEKEVLGGEDLDVVWNLTLAANLISANVEYGQIEKIKAIKGVKDVVIEMQYAPAVVDKEIPVDPQMATSTVMTGTSSVWSNYTGAGSLIAVIDTGIDDDHQSFDAGAFEYSLAQHDKADVDLLEQSEVVAALKNLNIADLFRDDEGKIVEEVAEMLYLNSKIPFAFNYIDDNFDITHDYDTQGEHGSHVTGIAAANDYIPVNGEEGKYVSALDSVHTQGVAPDAQIITMKVFGTGGGAFDSDYMVAIEDAIMLGADSINLSLGSSMGGFSHNDAYAEILNKIAEYGAVVTMSAGNSGNWAENAYLSYYGLPYLYADDVNLQTGGSPATYTNSLAVASVDNIGATGYYFTVGEDDTLIFYTETTSGSNKALSTIAGANDYVVIDGVGTDEEFAAIESILKGKIAVCYRGLTSFYEKAENAVKHGAIATIIVNNVDGSISMDLSDYTKTEPAVSVTYDEGELFWDNCEGYDELTLYNSEGVYVDQNEDPIEAYVLSYATGSINIGKDIASSNAELNEDGIYTMSSFSSWGVPGSLEMKPEITAPGGNIYSINGGHYDDIKGPYLGGSDQYENMSGTSMASPQVAGMAALIAEYIEDTGLLKKTNNLTQRQLIQSLLMSTAEPIFEDYGDEYGYGYYSILTQGAGLANVANVTSAPSYIVMDEEANSGAADGKVKVELGDDAAKEGVYKYSFTVYDLSGKDQTYTLDTDIFTQDQWSAYGIALLDTWTVEVKADTTYSVGDSFTVPANGSVTVDVTIAVDKDHLNEYVNGAYIEGFTYVIPENTEDGAVLPTHSIPILGFYGNWSDPSMFDRNSYVESLYGNDTIPYLYDNDYGFFIAENYLQYIDSVTGEEYTVIGNPYGIEEVYPADKAAIRSTDEFTDYYFSLIRNGLVGLVFTDENGEIIADYIVSADQYAAFYYDATGTWSYTEASAGIYAAPEDLYLAEGDRFTVSVVAVPEYYTKDIDHSTEDGFYELWDRFEELIETDTLGQGAYLSTDLRIDDTAPELLDAVKKNGALTVTATDNQYIAYMALMTRSGVLLFDDVLAPEMNEGGTIEHTFDVNIDDLGDFALVVVADYAGNESYYTVRLTDTYADADVTMNGITDDEDAQALLDYLVGNVSADELNLAVGDLDGDGRITTYDAHLLLCSLWEEEDAHAGEMYASIDAMYWMQIDTETAETKLIDGSYSEVLAAEYIDGYVFQILADGSFCVAPQSDPGLVDVITTIDLDEYDVMDMSYNYADDQLYIMDWYGNFYTINPLNGVIEEAFYLDIEDDALWFAIDNDGNFYTVAGTIAIDEEDYSFELSGSELLTWQYDGEEAIVPEVVAELSEDVAGDFAYDRDSNVIYMGEFYDGLLLSIDPATAEVTIVSEESLGFLVEGIYIVPYATDIVDSFAPTDEVESVIVDREEAELYVGAKLTLTAEVLPWNLTDRGVTWSSSDESVAKVNANGVVTGVDAGTVTITAASKVDASVTTSCEITVKRLEVTATGVLADADGNPKFFTWNIGEGTLEMGADVAMYPTTVTKVDNDTFYLVNTDGGMYKMDMNTGKAISGPSNWADFVWSAAYSQAAEGAWYVYGPYLMGPDDPDYDITTYGWNLASVLNGAYLMSVAVLDEEWAIPFGDDLLEGDHIVYAIDTYNVVWEFYMYWDEEEGGYSFLYGSSDSDLTASIEGWDGLPYSNLVVGDDYALYFSMMTGDTNELYRLEYDYDQDLWVSARLGDVGYDVWPALLFEVTSNDDAAVSDADRNVNKNLTMVTEKAEKLEKAEVRANISNVFTGEPNRQIPVAGSLNSVSVTSNAAAGKPAAAALVTGSEVEKAIVDTDTNTVTVKVYADNSTNALFNVGYDTEVLTLVSVDGLTEYYAYNSETAGKVAFDYAAEGVLNQQVAELVFTYDEEDEDSLDTDITINVKEDSDQLDLDTVEIIPIDLTKDEPQTPSKPSTPTTPQNPDKPEVPETPEAPDAPNADDKGNGNPNSPMTGAEAGFLTVFMLFLLIGCGTLSVFPVKRRRVSK